MYVALLLGPSIHFTNGRSVEYIYVSLLGLTALSASNIPYLLYVIPKCRCGPVAAPRIMSVQELINEIMTDYRLNKSDI